MAAQAALVAEFRKRNEARFALQSKLQQTQLDRAVVPTVNSANRVLSLPKSLLLDCRFILLWPESEQALRQVATARSIGTSGALFAVQTILESLRNGLGKAVAGNGGYEACQPVLIDTDEASRGVGRRIDPRVLLAAPQAVKLDLIRRQPDAVVGYRTAWRWPAHVVRGLPSRTVPPGVPSHQSSTPVADEVNHWLPTPQQAATNRFLCQ